MRLFPKSRFRIEGETNVFTSPKNKRNELLRYGNVKIKGHNNQVTVGAPNRLKSTEIIINGNNNTIVLPEHCWGGLKLNIRASNTTVIVGNNSGFMGTEIVLEENNSKVLIGEDCIIAKETRIYCSDFHAIFKISDGIPFNQGKEIIIGNHVWLGEGVKILKNTHLADNIIVGTNSLVTKDLPLSYALYVGNPATLKKKGINWQHENFDSAFKKIG